MSTGADNIAVIRADLVEALRSGLYIEQSAATDALRSDPRPRRSPNRYKRVDEARDLLDRIGHRPSDTPVTVQVNLGEHRRPLLAALHGKLEADAHSLTNNGARDPQTRVQAIAEIEALSALISSIEARGQDHTKTAGVERELDAQLARALGDLGYDEDRGDWWRVTYDAGNSWGVKSVIDGNDRNFDVTRTGYTPT